MITELVEGANVRIWMGEKEVGMVNVENDKSTARMEVRMNAESAEVEQGTVRVVVVQAELYHPKRRQPHREPRKRHQDEGAR